MNPGYKACISGSQFAVLSPLSATMSSKRLCNPLTIDVAATRLNIGDIDGCGMRIGNSDGRDAESHSRNGEKDRELHYGDE